MDGLNYMTRGTIGDAVWPTNRDGTVVEGLDQVKFPNIGR